jgi:hypothetical protein
MGKTSAIAAASALFLGATLAAAVPAAANATTNAQPAIIGSPVVNGSLSAVSASSSRDAWAVGTQSGATAPNLAEHWNGTTWTRVPVPTLRGQFFGLGSIADISPADAWATGRSYDLAQILHWNGKAWSRVPIPSLGSSGLGAIGAASASDIWAVGSGASLHWNGKTWTRVPVPVSGLHNLNSVKVLSPGNAWAVGSVTVASSFGDISANLILHWNGKTWARIPSPAPIDAKYGDFLNGITAVSAGDIWAVGCTDGCQVQGEFNPQIERWNGKTWKQVAAPATPYGIYALNSVAAASAGDAWAVGGGGPGTALSGAIAHWNGGGTWKLSPGLRGTQLYGVTALSTGDAWAVGVAQSGATGRALILHWNGKAWARS